MTLRNPKKNLRKESWHRTSGTTKWDKLGQVGVVGQVGQGEGGLQILVWQVEQGEGFCLDKLDKDKGSVHLNHSTCPKWDYKAVESCKNIKGWPPRDAPSKLVPLWYKTFPPDQRGLVEMKNPTRWVIKPVPHELVRRIRFWRIKVSGTWFYVFVLDDK